MRRSTRSSPRTRPDADDLPAHGRTGSAASTGIRRYSGSKPSSIQKLSNGLGSRNQASPNDLKPAQSSTGRRPHGSPPPLPWSRPAWGVSLLPELATSTQRTRAELRPVADMALDRRLLAAARSGSAQHPAVAAVLDALTTTANPTHPTAVTS
jgi:hypothetical protein